MARRRKDPEQRLRNVVSVGLMDADAKRLESEARRAGMSPTTYARRLVLERISSDEKGAGNG